MQIAIITVSVLLIVWLGAGVVFYNMSLSRRVGNNYRRERFDPKKDEDRALYEWEQKLSPTPVALSVGKIKLTGLEYIAEKPSNRWVIAIHGHGLSKEFMRYAAYFLHGRGINTLSVDLRAHGDSGGHATSMGWEDRRDIALWASELQKRYPECEIALFGISLGAATAVMAAGEDSLPRCVKSVVADSPFSDAPRLFEHICKNLFRLPPRLILPSYKIAARVLSGLKLRDVSPISQIQKGGELPILFIHGTADTLIPHAMSEELRDAAGARARLYSVPDAKHACGFLVDPQYWDVVCAFLDEYWGK